MRLGVHILAACVFGAGLYAAIAGAAFAPLRGLVVPGLIVSAIGLSLLILSPKGDDQ